MKIPFILLAALTGSAFAVDDVIPVAFGKDRYAEMSQQSPFVLATVEEKEAPAPVNPFANIVLRGLGSDYVVIQRVGDDHTIRISKDDTVEGFHVKTVNWSNQAGGSNVILTSDGKEGTVEFDKNLVRNSTPAAGAGGMQVNGLRRPMGPQGAAMPRPPGAGMPQVSAIPRPTIPAVQTPPQPQQQQRQYGGQRGQGGQGNGGFRGQGGGGGAPTSDANGGRTRIRDMRNTQIQNR